jgi:hypothetical protein
MFCCDEEFLKVERKEGEMVGKLKEERMGYDRMKTFYENREQSLRLGRLSFAMTILSPRCLSVRIGLSVRGLP